VTYKGDKQDFFPAALCYYARTVWPKNDQIRHCSTWGGACFYWSATPSPKGVEPQRSPPQKKKKFWTSYICPQGITDSDKILRGNQIRRVENLYGIDHAPALDKMLWHECWRAIRLW